MVLVAHQSENFISRVHELKIVRIIHGIVDFFHPNPNQTHPFHRHRSEQSIEQIKIFQKLKEKMDLLHFGRTRSQPLSKEHIANTLLFTAAVTFNCLFLVFVANEIDEILDSTYMTTAAISVYSSQINMISVTPKVFKFMDVIEEFINGSEFF